MEEDHLTFKIVTVLYFVMPDTIHLEIEEVSRIKKKVLCKSCFLFLTNYSKYPLGCAVRQTNELEAQIFIAR